MNVQIKNFISYVVTQTTKYEISCRFEAAPFYLDDNVPCAGFFDDENKVLVVATKKPEIEWLEILVHEFSHFEQWRDKCPIWIADINGNDPSTQFFDWINGKDLEADELNFCLKIARDCEADCERRTVENIKKFDLPIDINKYIKKSNAYIYFYNHIKNTRKWSEPNESAYTNEEIVNAMPNKFVDDYSITPDHLSKLYFKYFPINK